MAAELSWPRGTLGEFRTQAAQHRQETREAGNDEGGIIDLDRLVRCEPRDQRRHRDPMIHMGGNQAAAWNVPETLDDQDRHPSISTVTPLARSMAAVASSRSDSLTRSSCRPRMTVVPSA